MEQQTLNAAHTLLPRVDFTSMHVLCIDEWSIPTQAPSVRLEDHAVYESNVAPHRWHSRQGNTASDWFDALVENIEFDNGF